MPYEVPLTIDGKRVWVRLKAPLRAGEEITVSLPDTLKEYEEAAARGELKILDLDRRQRKE
jgi:hypothetical protein